MTEDQSVKDELKKVHQGRGRKTVYLVLALLGVTVLIGAFIGSTRGTDVEKSSAAMVEAVPKEAVGFDAGTVPVP